MQDTPRDMGSIPRLGRSPGVGNGNSLPAFLPGKFHGQRSLAGYSPQGHKELGHDWETAHIHGFLVLKFFIKKLHDLFVQQQELRNLDINLECEVNFSASEI